MRRSVHNDYTDVKFLWKTESTQSNPNIKASLKPVYSNVINNFPCRITQIESGKLNRIFRHRLAEHSLPAGFWDNVAYEVSYVDGLHELVAHTGVASGIDSSTIVEEAGFDFLANLPVRDTAFIRNNTDGSYAKVVSITASQITTEALTGGTTNLYQAGDEFDVMIPTWLQEKDQIFVVGRWRNVLLNVQDSEGLQHTAFVSD